VRATQREKQIERDTQRGRERERLSKLIPDVFMCIYVFVIGEGRERETEREREVAIVSL
jgi:hypothetical protein